MTGRTLPQEVFVRALGKGAHQMLALHCTIAHSGAWSGLAAALSAQASLIAPDMLSHGRSPDWDGRGDFFDRMTELAASQLQKPMDVIGHSFGAMIALRLAVEHPDLVRRAILIEPVFFALAKLDAPDLYDQHERDAEPFVSALAAGNASQAARLFNRMWSTQDSPRWADLPDRTRAAMIRGVHVVPASNNALYKDGAGLLQPGKLERAQMPVRILSGSLTHPVIPAICNSLQRLLPAATTELIPGAGHMLPISHPKETARSLSEFFRIPLASSV